MVYCECDPSRNIVPNGWHVLRGEAGKELEMTNGMGQTEVDGYLWCCTNKGSKQEGNESLWHNGSLENDTVFSFNKLKGFVALSLTKIFLKILIYDELAQEKHHGYFT